MSKKLIEATKPAAQNKGVKVVKLLQRNNRATIDELIKATGWQAHSVRGFISGTLKEMPGLEIISSKEENKDRCDFAVGKAQ
jgi:hypothetical protein